MQPAKRAKRSLAKRAGSAIHGRGDFNQTGFGRTVAEREKTNHVAEHHGDQGAAKQQTG